jgi:hypothetical protein
VLPFELMYIPSNHAIDSVRLDIETPWALTSIQTQRRLVPLSTTPPPVIDLNKRSLAAADSDCEKLRQT